MKLPERLSLRFSDRQTRIALGFLAVPIILLILSVTAVYHIPTRLFALSSSAELRVDADPSSLRTLPSFPEYDDDAPYSAVVLYLASWKRGAELITSLSYLRDNLPMRYPWPILLFHSGDFDHIPRQAEFKQRLHEYIAKVDGTEDTWRFMDRLEFVKVEFSLPEGVPNDVNAVDPVAWHRHAWPGYHHMCRFFTSQVFDHPRLQNVTYYMRLDTDSYIKQKTCYDDPFEVMYREGRIYGYRVKMDDLADVTLGMFDLVHNYSTSHPQLLEHEKDNGLIIPESSARNTTGFPLYYNNFEIVKLDAFRTPEVKDWFDTINSDPLRFYKYRWGDAPLRFATVNMFYDVKTQVKEFCGIPYFHFVDATNNCACT